MGWKVETTIGQQVSPWAEKGRGCPTGEGRGNAGQLASSWMGPKGGWKGVTGRVAKGAPPAVLLPSLRPLL